MNLFNIKSLTKFIVICCFLITNLQAKTFQSGPTQVSLLELYSSEGCSSCPPADRWISRFKNSEYVWKMVIPMVFHVDYWDYLGWTDDFAKDDYSQRQYDYKESGNISSVYTPGFLLNGEEWRGFFQRQGLPNTMDREVGFLKLQYDAMRIQVKFQPLVKISDVTYELHFVILGFDKTSKVTSGENKGRQLTHQFVVLEHRVIERQEVNNLWNFEPPKINTISQELGVAAWITEADSLRVVQAVGGFLN